MRLRFTIRDLLWLTALVAMGLGWWLDRSQVARQLDVAKRAVPAQIETLKQELASQKMENACWQANFRYQIMNIDMRDFNGESEPQFSTVPRDLPRFPDPVQMSNKSGRTATTQ